MSALTQIYHKWSAGFTRHFDTNSKEAGTQEGPCFLTIKLVLLLSTAVEQRCKRIGIGLENL